MPAAAKKLVRKAGCERGSSRYKAKAVDTEGGGEDHGADEQYKRCKGKGKKKNKSSSTSSMAAAAVAKTTKNNVAVLKQQLGKANASNKASKTIKKANPAEEKDQDHESKSNRKEQPLSYFPSAPKSHKMIQEQQAEQQDHDYRGTRATSSGCGVEIQILKTDGDGVGQEDQQLSTGFGLTSTAAGGFFSTASISMVCGRGGGSAEGVEPNAASLKALHLQKKSSIGGGNTNVVLFGEAVLAGPGDADGDGHDKQDDVEGKKNNSKSVKLQVQVDHDLELDELAAPKIVEPAQPAAPKMKRMARKMVHHDLKSQADVLGVADRDDHASTFVVVEKNAHCSAATGGGAPGEEPPTKKRRGNYSKAAMKKVKVSKSKKGKERGGAASLDVVEVNEQTRSANVAVSSSDLAFHVEEENVESNFYYVRCEHSVTCGGIVKVAKDDPKLLKLKTELVNPSCVKIMLSATTASAAASSSTAKKLQQDAGSHSKSEGSSMNKSSSSTAAPPSRSAASSASPAGKLETDDIWECEACAKLWRCWGATTDCRRRVPKFASYCEQCEAAIAFNCDLNCVEGRSGNCVDECCGLDDHDGASRINITAASQASSLGGNKTIRRLSIESIEGRMKRNKKK